MQFVIREVLVQEFKRNSDLPPKLRYLDDPLFSVKRILGKKRRITSDQSLFLSDKGLTHYNEAPFNLKLFPRETYEFKFNDYGLLTAVGTSLLVHRNRVSSINVYDAMNSGDSETLFKLSSDHTPILRANGIIYKDERFDYQQSIVDVSKALLMQYLCGRVIPYHDIQMLYDDYYKDRFYVFEPSELIKEFMRTKIFKLIGEWKRIA